MDVLAVISIGSLVLRGIAAVQAAFDGEDSGADKKAVVMNVAKEGLKKAIPDADEGKLAEADAVLDDFIEAGVKLMKAVQK